MPKKTNAARLLDDLGISYTLHEVEVDDAHLSAEAMANRLGVAPEEVFKTLVARGDKHGILMACVPGGSELDLKKLASASGNKRVEMVALKEVQPLTGYIRGGCSPLAAKKAYPVYIDESAIVLPQIFVSAGHRGVQLHLAPDDLLRAANGLYVPLTVS